VASPAVPSAAAAVANPADGFRLIAGVVLAVQACQVALLWKDPSVSGLTIDAYDFHREAMRIAAGQPAPHVLHFNPPLFPWLLALFYRLLGSQPQSGLLLQSALSLLISWEIFSIGRLLLTPRAALVAGILSALYGPLLFFDAQLLAAPLDAAAALGALLYALRTTGSSGWRSQLLLGVLGGVAIVSRGTIAPFVLFLALRPFFELRPALGKAARQAAVVCGGVFLGLLPVGLSNWVHTQRFSLSTVNAGVNFWIGNNPNVEATTALRPGHAWDRMFSEPARHGALTLEEQSRWFLREALSWILHNPFSAALTFLMKLGDTFNGLAIPRNLDAYGPLAHTPIIDALLWRVPLLRFPFGIVLPLGFYGVWRWWRSGDAGQRRAARTLAAFVLLNAFGICLFFPSDRYRLAMELGLLVPAVAGALGLWQRVRLKRREPIHPGGAIAFLTIALWANLAPQLTGPHLEGDVRTQRALGAMNAGRLDEAADLLQAIVNDFPDNADAWRTLGALRVQQGDEEAALEPLEHAVALAPDYARAWQQMGAIFLDQGRPAGAETSLNMAVEADPAEPYAWIHLTEAYLAQQKYKDAIHAGRQAIIVSPDNVGSWRYLGAALRADGDLKEAEPVLRKAIDLDPNGSAQRYQLALTLVGLGRREEARQEAAEILRLVPDHHGAMTILRETQPSP
jgi:tetratricopeptide (TPR) repeat protein